MKSSLLKLRLNLGLNLGLKMGLGLLLLTSVTACSVTQEEPLQLSMAPEDRLTLVASGDLSFIQGQATQDGQAFALHPDFELLNVGEEVKPEQLKSRMRGAITAVMQAKGYRQVPASDSPDLLIGYGVALGDTMSDGEILQKVGLVPGVSAQGVDMRRFEKGSVLLLVFDPRLIEPSWRVLAQGFTPLNQDSTLAAQQADERLTRVINKMLSELPQTP
ncbi:DUF4136 domain-containing protein [Shewanella rhizosphaerae]|uniref:DUF4136 domain-containing protein n=1 Tax=Shewanella rhizosphaerae TaxID=2864207 RepID=UPI001C65CE38|nr:DUF4136 domain-containing protein [Shewanella rhizosphaerae]QYK14529.1 DUF4136 domain-containing protein [Shewanella rhizosphaerae]